MGHTPALLLPHLESIAVRVSDTSAAARASDFKGDAEARVTVQRPAPSRLPPATASAGTGMCGGCCAAKGRVARLELAAVLPPASRVPAVASDPPRTPPHQAHVAGNATPQDLFSGPARPLCAPRSPRTPRPCPCPRLGTPARGGASGHTKGSLWSGREPAVQHAHSREGRGAPGVGRGFPAGRRFPGTLGCARCLTQCPGPRSPGQVLPSPFHLPR